MIEIEFAYFLFLVSDRLITSIVRLFNVDIDWHASGQGLPRLP